MAVIKVYSTHISQTGPTPTFKNIYHFYTTWLQLQHIAIFQHISGKSFGGIKTSIGFFLLKNHLSLFSWGKSIWISRFGKNVKIVHFIGASKPWKCSFDRNGDPVPNLPEDSNSLIHLKNWWNIHKTEILPKRQKKVRTKNNRRTNQLCLIRCFIYWILKHELYFLWLQIANSVKICLIVKYEMKYSF